MVYHKGDFCRRFVSPHQIGRLIDAIDEARLQVWARQPKKFFEQAIIDADGHLVGTAGQCKEGMDIAYDGTWGYHPLLVSPANTGEVLSLVNRSGNRPSHEGAAAEIVFSCNDRCNQENLIEQLSNGVHAFRAPVDNLLSNWAYMVMTSLAWNLKAWWALWLPEKGRWAENTGRKNTGRKNTGC